MATAADLFELLRPGLVPVPAAGEGGVCRVCHSGCSPDFQRCRPCEEAARLGLGIEVVPISMSINGQLLHHHLWGYKNDRSPTVRTRMTRRLAALLAVHLAHHGRCLGAFDTVVSVPSEARCAPAAVIGLVGGLRPLHRPVLSATGVGTKQDLRADRFRVTESVHGERVLLFDDTFTRGPTIFSAAAALQEAGAAIVGPLVLGRHIQPTWPASEALLAWLAERQWDEARCCRCGGERFAPDRLPY